MNDALFKKRHKKSYKEVVEVCERSLSMVEAAKTLNIPYKTLIRVAKKLGCYYPNPAGRGISKPNIKGQYKLEDILNGKHPQYHSHKLKLRLYKADLKKEKCEECGIINWNEKPISFHLDHINGNNSDHRLENLRILCPNCHSQTDTYSCKISAR